MKKVWTSREGLPSDGITHVMQDTKGFIWIGTYNGLVRFDGILFDIYSRSSRDGFPINSVNFMLEDAFGIIWIGTNGEGLGRLERDKFSVIDAGQGMPSRVVRSLASGPDGSLVAGTSNGLVQVDAKNTVHVLFPEYFDNTNIVSLFRENPDRLWVSGGEGELYMLEGAQCERITRSEILRDCQVLCFIADDEGTLWFGTQNKGLFRLQVDRLESMKPMVSAKTINALSMGRQGEIWIGTDSGLFRYYRDRIDHFNLEKGLEDDQVSSVLEDLEGNLWLGTSRGGVTKLSQSKFQTLTQEQGLVDEKVNAIWQDGENGFWIGTDHGLSLYQDQAFIDHPLIQKVGKERVRHVQRDHLARVWVSTYSGNGVLMWNGREVKSWSVEQGLSGNRCRMTLVDSKGTVWIATTNGLNALTPDGSVRIYNRDQGLNDEYVLCVYEDRDGTLWVGTNGGGLHVLQDDGTFLHIEKTEGLPSEFIFRLFEDSRHNLWVTSSEGVSLFSKGKFFLLSTHNGLFGNAVFQMVEDVNHDVWMTADIGVFKASLADMLELDHGRAPVVSMELFDGTDGLRAAPTPVSFAYQTLNGEIWFPTLKGVAILDVKNIPVNTFPPPVFIEQIQIDSKSFGPSEIEEILPNYKRITLKFAGLSFVVPEKVYFQFMLEGFDSDWSELTLNREATYTTLSPGEYTFHVRAMNNDGLWSDPPATVSFFQPPTFSQTPWFYVTLILLTTGIVAALFWIRNRNLRVQQDTLVRMVRERTEEIQQKNEILEIQKVELEKTQIEIKKANNTLERIARTDSLTGIANRRHFEEHLKMEWSRSVRANTTLSLIMIDVDHFKKYNDYYGHQAGDLCLQKIAEALVKAFFRPTDLVARYGGEEFIAIITEAQPEAARSIVDRLLEYVRNLKIEHNGSVTAPFVTVSVGFASTKPALHLNAEDLIRRADHALYCAKENGRNQVSFYQE